jgi:hypothetical protein
VNDAQPGAHIPALQRVRRQSRGQRNQGQRQRHQQRRNGIHFRRHGHLDHRVDLQRQRGDADTGNEEGDHEIVDGEREAHQETGQHGRQDQRQGDAPKRLPGTGAEIARGLENAFVEHRQAGAHDDRDETDRESDVRNEDRDEAERQVEHLAEEQQQRHAEQNLGHCHRRQHEERQAAQQTVAPALHGDPGHRPEHGRQRRGGEGDEQRVGGGAEHLLVGEQRRVPARREADPLGVEQRVVEGEKDDHRQRQVEKGIDGERRHP